MGSGDIDMSDVFYNHVAWTDLNVLQEIGQGAFALVYEVNIFYIF